MKLQKRRHAFTLIELLIVVLIIAILASMAMPNFMEFQMRAKVARVKSDMRTLATAIEGYCVIEGVYINDSDNVLGAQGGQDGLARLTTPVAYISRLPEDPFQSFRDRADSAATPFYELGSGSDHQGWGSLYGRQGGANESAVQSWLLFSTGPDSATKTEEDDTYHNDQWPWGTRCITYDPTNGTISNGDIYRVGGDIGRGAYYVNEELMGHIYH